jgi:guanine deaminase
MKDDQYFLKKAIEVGNKAPKPYNFGVVIVKNGEIVAADHNHVHELNDPSAHDMISALRKAAKVLGTHNMDGCIAYGSHEPCFMCLSAAAWAHIEQVIYASPAKESKDFIYHSEELSIEEFARKMPRTIQVELQRVKS